MRILLSTVLMQSYFAFSSCVVARSFGNTRLLLFSCWTRCSVLRQSIQCSNTNNNNVDTVLRVFDLIIQTTINLSRSIVYFQFQSYSIVSFVFSYTIQSTYSFRTNNALLQTQQSCNNLLLSLVHCHFLFRMLKNQLSYYWELIKLPGSTSLKVVIISRTSMDYMN